MSINKISLNILVIALILIIGIPSIYKVVKHHQNAIYEVNKKLAIEKAQDCYYKKDCLNKKITLKELYDKKYIENRLVDPKTKEEYSEDSYVLINKKESIFYLG